MKKILAVALFAISTSAVAASPDFASGETLDYDLSWSRISGGSARMTIGKVAGEPAYRITSIGKSGTFFSRFFKVRDEIESIVSASDFSTTEYHKVLNERGKVKDELTVVNQDEGLAIRKGKSIKVPRPVFDPLSLIYHIRTLDLSPGLAHEFTVLADGRLYTLRATVLNRETITTGAGTFRCVVVEPKMESQAGVFRDEQNRLLIWYSDDDRHLPVRVRSDVKIGSITVSLRSYRSGVTSTEPQTEPGQ